LGSQLGQGLEQDQRLPSYRDLYRAASELKVIQADPGDPGGTDAEHQHQRGGQRRPRRDVVAVEEIIEGLSAR
jgi:hypothetical protein